MAIGVGRLAWRLEVPTAAGLTHSLIWPGLVIALVALAFRVHDIGTKSLWFDETVSLVNARQSFPDLLAATRADVHPPLYYAILHVWIGIRESQGFARLLSALFSSATTALTYMAGSRLLGSWQIGALAALLLALSPADVALAQEIRMYPLLELLAMASILALERALRRKSWWAWLAYGAVCALLPWTQYYGAFVLAAHALAIPVLTWRTPHLLARAYAALAAAGIVFLAWVPSFLAQLRAAHTAFWVPPFTPLEIAETGRQLAFSTTPDHGALIDPLTLDGAFLVGGLALVGALVVVIRARHAVLIPVTIMTTVALAIVLSLSLVPIYFTRYVLFALPEFNLLAAVGLADLRSPFSILHRRWVQTGAVALILVTDVICIQTWYTDPYYARPDLEHSALVIRQGFQPSDQIVYTSLLTVLPVQYYLGLANDYPHVNVEPPTRENVDAAVADARRVWLVRAEDTIAWGATVDEGVAVMMADFDLVEKWPLVGVAVYLYKPHQT
ncbi:MAG: hypothetical protein NVSMB2_05170 [Chloroflexota bacterium]